MSASFYDLMKYAHTGLATADMTAFDKLRAQEMAGGGAIKTLTGVPPLSFKSNGKPLVSWSMLGNSQQDGTPTPDAPIMPEFVGERTGNLFSGFDIIGRVPRVSDGTLVESQYGATTNFISIPDVGIVLSAKCNIGNQSNIYIFLYDNTDALVGAKGSTGSLTGNIEVNGNTISGYENAVKCRIRIDNYAGSITNIMLNTGSTPLPYEPYGWKIPITCAGQTTPIYLGQTQTVRRIKKLVLTGEEFFLVEPEFSRYSFQPASQLWSAGIRLTQFVCSHYMCIYDGRDISDVPNNSTYTGGATSNRIYIYTTDFSDLADFKNYLAQQYSAGTPVTIWYILANEQTGIVNEPLCKIGDYADELHSADAGVSIPTAKGQNTLTVDTDLQPSSMTITYR